MKEKIKLLSKTIVNYSLNIQKGDRVLISTFGAEARPLIEELIREITKVEGIPFVKIIDARISALLTTLTTEDRIKEIVKQKEWEVENYDCFISIDYGLNDYESKNVPSEIRKNMGIATEAFDDIRINERRWVLLNYPSPLDAHKAKMTTEEFEEYAFDVMTINYGQMEEMLKPLKSLMEKTDKVRVTGKDTDITFHIKDIPVVPCTGKSNIPDGEIFTAPIKDSVNGIITYNTPSPYHGNIYTNVSLQFENGKIVKATCNEDNEKLNEIFNSDEGARYVGEFSLGLNPKIREPMGDILFDEKIIGSIHFTPGEAYREANNGNKSTIHWDMVLIQREEYGGGEIYFDDVLIRKNGKFVLKELEHLNYDLQ